MFSISARSLRSWVPNKCLIFVFICGIVSVANLMKSARYIEDMEQQEILASTEETEEKICPSNKNNPSLIGKLPTDILSNEHLTEDEINAQYPELGEGGEWTPDDCHARHKIAIIIPYRDRKSHLARLLAYLIPVLQRQRLDFRFIVTEQVGNDLFNKGRIMNAAFKYADALGVDCVVFHDVDMVPQSDYTPYSCPSQPYHLGAFVDTLRYKLVDDHITGGALIMPMKHYRAVNGYSNLYWGWGGEDDDIGERILAKKYKIQRPDPKIVTFTMMNHVKRERTAPELMYKMLGDASKRMATDGLNQSLWNVKKISIGPLYHHLLVEVGRSSAEWRPKIKRSSFSKLPFSFLSVYLLIFVLEF